MRILFILKISDFITATPLTITVVFDWNDFFEIIKVYINAKSTHNLLSNLLNLNVIDSYLHRQQTPKPAAQVPLAFPPLSVHSEAV